MVTRVILQDGIVVSAAAAGTVGTAVEWTSVLTAQRNGTFQFLGNNVVTSANINTYGDARYLQLTGGTLSGALTGTSATFSGNVSSPQISTTYNAQGRIALNVGGAASAGFMELYNGNNIRLGYIGYDNNNIGYVAEGAAIHAFTGAASFTGALTGTSATFSSSVTASSLIKTGGTAAQFLKADGSVDANTYLTSSGASGTYLPLTAGAGNPLTGELTINAGERNLILKSTVGIGSNYIQFQNNLGVQTSFIGHGSSSSNDIQYLISGVGNHHFFSNGATRATIGETATTFYTPFSACILIPA